MSKRRVCIAVVLLLTAVLVAYESWPERIEGTVIEEYGALRGRIHLTPRLSVQCWLGEDLFATRNREIFRSADKGLTWVKVAEVPGSRGLKGWVSELKVMRPFSRPYPMPVLARADGTILAVSNGVRVGELTDGEVVELRTAHSGPRCLMQGLDEDRQGAVFYGEYQRGDHPETRLLWSRDSGRAWEVRASFPRAEIEHIHCVQYDAFRDLLWVGTGDADHESRIMFSADQGASFEAIGSGSQEWRAVSLQFTEEGVYWGTDTPEKPNDLFYWERDTGTRTKLLTVRNPFYYSAGDGLGNVFFSTGAEDEKYGGEEHAELYRIGSARRPERLLRLKRGDLPYSGMIVFAQGEGPDGWVAMSPMNIEGRLSETVVFQTGVSGRAK
jgi:hypothetical protein